PPKRATPDVPPGGRNSGHRWTSQKCLLADISAPRCAERDLWNIRLLKQPHSDLMPANLITLTHFSVSSAISFPKSAGDPGSATPPRSARRAFILGSSRAALTSLLSLSTISAGVALGAPRPDQLLASYPGTNSPTVGTSGSASERVAVATARARSLPALMYSIDEGMVANMTCTCPL